MRSINLKDMWKTTPFSFIILTTTIVVYLFQMVFQFTEGYLYLETMGAINRFWVLDQGEYYRIISAGFLHGNLIHLFFNVIFGIGVLTTFLERILGSRKTAVIYFFSMILSGFLVVAVSDIDTWTLGASGAIYGVLGSLLYMILFRKDLVDARTRQTVKSLLIMNIIFTFIYPNISIMGHFGGLIGGFLISFLLIPRDKSEYEIYS